MTQIDLYTHPEYGALAGDWQTYKDLYEGHHGVLTAAKYLWYHELEGGVQADGVGSPILQTSDSIKLRSRREQRTQYYNVIKPIVSRFLSIFFCTPPTFKDVEPIFGEQIKDVTGTGQSLAAFLKDDVLFNLIVYGRAFVVTNAPDKAVQNQTEEKKTRIPYFESLNPLDVKDWQVEIDGPNKGKLRFVRWEYTIIPPREKSTDAPEIKKRSKEMRLVGNTFVTITYELCEGEGLSGAKQNERQMVWREIKRVELPGWNYLPVQAVFSGESWLKELAGEAVKLHNLISSRDNILYYQGYKWVFITGVNNEEQKKAIAEYTISFLPDGATVVEAEPANTTSIEQAIEKTILNIFRMAYGVTRMLPVSSDAAESAQSKQEDRKALESLILSEIETIENLANAIARDYAEFKGRELSGEIKFSRDLTSFDVEQEITIYQALRDEIMKVPTWRKEVLKKFAETQNLNKLSEIMVEIDKMSEMQTGITQNGLSVRNALSQRLNGNTPAADQAQASAA